MKRLAVSSKPYLITPHRTDFYHVFLFTNCSPNHLVDFNPIKVRPYSLLFINKDRVHQFDRFLNYDGYVLIFTDDFFCNSDQDTKFLHSTILFNDLVDKPELSLSKDTFNRFWSIANSILEEQRLPDDSSKHQILKNLLHTFLLFADREKRKQGYAQVKKGADLDYTILYKDLVEKNFAQLKNVSAYAGKLHVSEKRLGQATAKILGKTLKEIIDERVLLEAKRLLVHGSQSIKEIGFELGFDEPTNFIKYFRKHIGKTPVEFRDEYSQ